MSYIVSPEKKQLFLTAYPELATLMRLEFDSYDDFKQIAEGRGISLPQNAWQYFSPEEGPEQKDNDNIIDESLKKDHKDHNHIFHSEGKRINADKTYRNIVTNTVRDWNQLHKNAPDLQIKGKVYIKKGREKILNPEVVTKLPQIHTHANEVFSTAYGSTELHRYKQKLENAPFKNPLSDPILQGFERQVASETQRRIQEKETELQQKVGPKARLTDEEKREIENEIRRGLFSQLVPGNRSRIEAYAKRRFRGRIPWLKKTYKDYKKDAKQQYKTQAGFEKRVVDRTKRLAQTEISRLKAVDLANNVKRNDSWYEQQINKQAIQKTAQQEELRSYTASTRGMRNFFFRRSGYAKNLENAQKELEKFFAEQKKKKTEEEKEKVKKLEGQKRIRDPKNDERIQELKKSVPEEAEKERQRVYNERLKETTGRRRYVRGIWYETNGTKLTPITPPDRKPIEDRLKQEKYHKFFEDNLEQAKRYARHDNEIGEEYRKWGEKTILERQKKEEAQALGKKRGIFKRIIHKFRPFKRNYLTLPGQETPENPIKISRFQRLKSRLARPFIPALNRLDTFRDWAHRTNQKYNPYEIAKRRIKRRNEIIKKRIGELNQKYNPYEIAKRRLREARKALFAQIRSGMKSASKAAWSGGKQLGSAGFRGASKGLPKAGNALSRAGSRLSVPRAGQNLGTGILKRAPGALIALSFGWWVAIIAIGVAIFLIIFLLNQDEEELTGELEVTLTTTDLTRVNPPPNVTEVCIGNNCVTDAVEGASTSVYEESGQGQVLQATDDNTGPLDSFLDKIGDISKLIAQLGENIRDSLITYDIHVYYSGQATDIRVRYPIPSTAYFISASGKYTEEKNSEGDTTAVIWSVRENQGGGNPGGGANSCGIGSPNTPFWQKINEYDSFFAEASEEFGVPGNLMKSMAWIESGGQGHINPATGRPWERDDGFGDGLSIGMMQVKPGIWQSLVPNADAYDARGNVRLGTAIMAKAIRDHGSWQNALTRVYFPANDPNGTTQNMYVDRVTQYMAELDAAATCPGDTSGEQNIGSTGGSGNVAGAATGPLSLLDPLRGVLQAQTTPSPAQSGGNLTFDEAKFESYGFPPPQNPNPVTLNPQALQRWKQYGMPAAVKAGSLTGVDPGIIGYWSFAEGLNYDMTLNVCGPQNENVGVNRPCATNNWQAGNFGAQPANANNLLQEAFDAMYGNHDDATVKRVGQSVIDQVQARHGTQLTFPSSTFPTTSLSNLTSKFNSSVNERAWVGHLARDDALGAYVQAKVFQSTLGPNFADSILYGYGSKQNIINHIKAIYDAGLSGTPGSSGGGGGNATFSRQTFTVTILPKDPDTFFNSGSAEAEVIGARGGGSGGGSSNPQATGDLAEILGWGQQINDALEPGTAYAGTWYNRMVTRIGNGNSGASGAVNVGGYEATIRPGNSEADLYWCTFTIIDSYNLAGHTGMTPAGHLAVMNMIPFFAQTSGFKYLNYNDDYNGSRDKKVISQVKPGYAFFIMNHFYSGGHTGQEHTGMIKNISVDANGNGFIETLESNSTAKSHNFTIANWEVLNTPYPMRGFGGI